MKKLICTTPGTIPVKGSTTMPSGWAGAHTAEHSPLSLRVHHSHLVHHFVYEDEEKNSFENLAKSKISNNHSSLILWAKHLTVISVKLVETDLPFLNTCWLFLVTYLSLVMVTKRICSIIFYRDWGEAD